MKLMKSNSIANVSKCRKKKEAKTNNNIIKIKINTDEMFWIR